MCDERAPILWIELIHLSQTSGQMFIHNPGSHSISNDPLWAIQIKERYLHCHQIIGISELWMLRTIVLCKRSIGCAIEAQLASCATGYTRRSLHEVAN